MPTGKAQKLINPSSVWKRTLVPPPDLHPRLLVPSGGSVAATITTCSDLLDYLFSRSDWAVVPAVRAVGTFSPTTFPPTPAGPSSLCVTQTPRLQSRSPRCRLCLQSHILSFHLSDFSLPVSDQQLFLWWDVKSARICR